jgi:hypothetical protein
MPRALLRLIEKTLKECHNERSASLGEKPLQRRTSLKDGFEDLGPLFMILMFLCMLVSLILIWIGSTGPFLAWTWSLKTGVLMFCGVLIILALIIPWGDTLYSIPQESLPALISICWMSDRYRVYLVQRDHLVRVLDKQLKEEENTGGIEHALHRLSSPYLVDRSMFLTGKLFQILSRYAGKIMVRQDPRLPQKGVHMRLLDLLRDELKDLVDAAYVHGLCDTSDRGQFFKNPIIIYTDWKEVGLVPPDEAGTGTESAPREVAVV